nr:MAG TPA: activity-regulated cytoskeleton associated protein 1 [Caudoviricetes sp.]
MNAIAQIPDRCKKCNSRGHNTMYEARSLH